jgi:hypothetical protein
MDFMDARDVNPADTSKQHVEFIRYRHDMQDFRLKNMARLIKQLRTARKAFHEAKLDSEAADRDKYLEELGKKQVEGQKSQEAINNFLK